MALNVHVAPTAFDQVDEEWLPDYQPYVYQYRVLELAREAFATGETICIFLVTPTGSGKTLASFAISFLTGKPALGVYPTNELIRDQERALAPEYKKAVGWDDWVLRIDSERLDKWGLDLGEPRHSQALEIILRWERVILTNPDILFYIVFGQYPDINGLRYQLFSTLADVYRITIFDEFHLYNVKQMADVAFYAGVLDAINPGTGRVFIFASATPESPARDWMAEQLKLRVETVEAHHSDAPDARTIAHPVRLTVAPADLTRWQGPGTLVEHLPLVDQFFNDYPEARLVTILDSVAGAVNIADAFRERYPARGVGEVHGLSSLDERESALRQPITVGTSTIEVGIDFKDETEKDVLIYEARTAAQNIQRFGRLARHEKDRPNWVLSFVPEYVYHALCEEVEDGCSLSRTQLYDSIRSAYSKDEDFSQYLSRHAPAEFHEAKEFLKYLFFEQDNRERIVANIEHVIEALTGKSARKTFGIYRHYCDENILAPLMTFRGTGFEAALLDERDTDPGCPAKRYNLMFLLRRGNIREISEGAFHDRLDTLADRWPEEVAREQRFAQLIKPHPDELLGVYGFFRLKGLLDEGRHIYFVLPEDEVRGRKAQVTTVRDLEICTDPPIRLPLLNRHLEKKRIVAWFNSKHPKAIHFGRGLPPLFSLHELRVRGRGGGLKAQPWSIAFNQDAFFVDSLGWWKDQREDTAIML